MKFGLGGGDCRAGRPGLVHPPWCGGSSPMEMVGRRGVGHHLPSAGAGCGTPFKTAGARLVAFTSIVA